MARDGYIAARGGVRFDHLSSDPLVLASLFNTEADPGRQPLTATPIRRGNP